MKKTMAALAASAVLVPGAVVLASSMAQAAPEDSGKTGVRAADLIPALSDTRATGHKEFLAEGIHVWTEGSTGTDKVAEYFAIPSAFPTSGSMEWFGTASRPGMQLVVDFDADGTADGILVGEPTFYADRWWANNQANAWIAAHPAAGTAPGPADGYQHSDTLAAWKTAYPSAVAMAGGFSLGSGVKGDGVLRSITFGSTTYVPTNEAKPTTPTPGQGTTTTPTPTATTTAKPAKDVTGTVKAKTPNSLRIKLNFVSDATPANFSEGKALKYKVKVDGVLASKVTQGASEKDVFARVFPRNSGTHKVQVYKDGALVSTYKVRTS
jgi:hypothetical protein